MFTEQTYEVIKNRILDNTTLNIDKRTGSFLDTMISGIVEEVSKVYIDMGDILNLIFIEDGFNDFLDKRVGDFGVYRKLGVKATGEIKVTGTQGTTIENGTIVTANDLNYIVLNDITLSDTDDILYVEALEVGYKYNLLANIEFKLIEANSNITSLVNEIDFVHGIDIESDEELKARFKKVVDNPATSNNKYQFEQWALEVDGVGKATVYPLWDGNGSVKVLIVGNDNKPVSAEIITNTYDYIQANKSIWGTVTVATPTELDITIIGSVELKNGYILEDVKASFEDALNTYLKTVSDELTYSKVYGILVNLLGVGDIVSLVINDATSNIAIPSDKLINISSITLSEVV